ncbi:MAG: beta-glucuronidase, partial [Clostridia bacterium]|nr:beta-glucuronidase [Clostridia bacterium]
MRRMFDEHVVRKVISLDGAWKFMTDPGNVGEAQAWYREIPEGALHMEVPSCWNNSFGLLEYEGAAWYSKQFYCEGGCIRLCFGAVMTAADVWLDGEKLGSHYGGFSAFDFTAIVEEGYHLLTVRADNRFGADSIPQAKVDWYHYGGIVRGVDVEMLKGVSVSHCHLDYQLNEARDEAVAVVRAKLFNATGEAVTAPLCVWLDSEVLFKTEVTLDPHEEVVVESEQVTIGDIHLWDMKDPYLYTLRAETDTDDLYDRVGFRTIEVKDGTVQLNGRAIEIRGVCRHEEHPEFGFAFPRALMQRDIDIIKEMSGNAVRGAHYPNSKAFVDMLDEQGLLFWSEIPIWGVGFSEEAIANPTVVARGLAMIREMVEQYYNHPSIIIWGMHNEILTGTAAAYEMSRQYHDE